MSRPPNYLILTARSSLRTMRIDSYIIVGVDDMSFNK